MFIGRFVLALFALITASFAADSAKDTNESALDGRVFLEKEDHSIRLPLGWVARRIEQGGVLCVPPDKKDGLYLSVYQLVPDGRKLANTIAKYQKSMKEDGFETESSKEFKTQSNLTGTKLRFRNEKRGLVEFDYVFENILRQRVIVTCQVEEAKVNAREKLFDAVASSLCALNYDPSVPAELGESYEHPQPKFSFKLPRGWERHYADGTIFGPVDVRKGTELAIKVLEGERSLADFAELRRKSANTVSLAPVELETFTTAADARAFRLRWLGKADDGERHAIQHFFFQGKDGQIINAFWVVRAQDEGKFEKIIVESMKTFRSEMN